MRKKMFSEEQITMNIVFHSGFFTSFHSKPYRARHLRIRSEALKYFLLSSVANNPLPTSASDLLSRQTRTTSWIRIRSIPASVLKISGGRTPTRLSSRAPLFQPSAVRCISRFTSSSLTHPSEDRVASRFTMALRSRKFPAHIASPEHAHSRNCLRPSFFVFKMHCQITHHYL